MTAKIFVFGQGVPLACRAVALDWHSTELRDGTRENALQDVTARPGVYAFEGCHDASPSGCILYIGQTGGRSASTLPERLAGSLPSVWRRCEDGKMRIHSDVWNVTIRWAEIVDSKLVMPVEHLLIAAHSPGFNNHHSRENVPDEYKDLMVLNAGRKGRLVPIVLGSYLSDRFWPDSTA